MSSREKAQVSGKSSFQEQLAKSVSKKVIMLVAISCVLFILGQVVMTFISNEMNARHHLETLTNSFCELDSAEREFLEDPRTMKLVKNLFQKSGEENGDSKTEFARSFRRFFKGQTVTTNYIITSADKRVIDSSYADINFSTYLINYVYASCYRAGEEGDGVYRTVYYDIGEYADPMYILPVREEGKLMGYLTLLLSGSSWNYYLSEKNFDGVVTDLRNNVMYTSKHGLVTSMNKFKGTENPQQTFGTNGPKLIEGSQYWIVSQKLEDREAIVYSLVYFPVNVDYLIGILVMVLAGMIWKKLADDMARDMAARNATSIDNLVRELRIIRKENPEHRIQISSDDEFSEVGMQINRMMDAIRELNSRNTELALLNVKFEMNELTEQMNPHFLYNTLEIIRNLVYFDAQKASELIARLTEILRYSVNATKREVPFAEDMEYINKYLQIQYVRFGERLRCDIDTDPACDNVIIPKLLLQPIIENSIKYGFRHQMELHIKIRVRMVDSVLTVNVSDNGGGIDPEKIEILRKQLLEHDNSAESIGLRNLSRRLYLRYGPGSGVSVRNTEDPGTEVTVTVNTAGSGIRFQETSSYTQEGKEGVNV